MMLLVCSPSRQQIPAWAPSDLLSVRVGLPHLASLRPLSLKGPEALWLHSKWPQPYPSPGDQSGVGGVVVDRCTQEWVTV
jgi:hypothetical protein